MIPIPKKIIYNGPATVVMWTDGTKTVVKKAKGQRDDKYSAFCSALAIKLYGSNSAVKRRIRRGEEGRPRLLWESPKAIATEEMKTYYSKDYMKQFAVGEKVRVTRERPQHGYIPGAATWVPAMDDFCGRVLRIRDVNENCQILLDNGFWYRPEWLILMRGPYERELYEREQRMFDLLEEGDMAIVHTFAPGPLGVKWGLNWTAEMEESKGRKYTVMRKSSADLSILLDNGYWYRPGWLVKSVAQ